MSAQIDGNSENRMDDVLRRLTFLKDLHNLTHRIQCPRCAARYEVTRDMIV